jgi:hypothetical protein
MSETMPTPEQTLGAMHAVVQAKAAQDAAFRAELLANPRAAVEKLFGTALPAHVKLQAVEQPADTYVVVVPTAAAVGAGGELSDADLEAVAGGSKSGAKQFFNDIGNDVVDVGKLFGSSIAGAGMMGFGLGKLAVTGSGSGKTIGDGASAAAGKCN